MLRTLLSLILLTFSITAWSATTEGLRLSDAIDGTRLVIDLSNEVSYKTFTLDKPHRLVIDLRQTRWSKKVVLPDFSGPLIKNIRHAQRDGTLRLVLDLSRTVKYDTHKLSSNQTHPYRIVVDLHDPRQATTSTVKKPVTPAPTVAVKPETKPTQVVIASKPKPPIIIKPKSKPKRDIVIAIDAGHGGKDPGAIGKHGTKEKDIVFSIAKRLANLVNEEQGMRAYLVRTDDYFLSLRQRIKRAHQQKADMFISIHADGFHNSQAKGASVYVLSQRGASSEAAQLLADKENAADLIGGISLEDKDDLLASVLLDLSQTASLEASIEVANAMLSGLKRIGNVHKKQVESASFVVLKSPDIPSVLIETAFLSNPAEERKLNTASHQNKLARAMMLGIRNYFQRNPLPGTYMDQRHIVSSGDTLSTIAKRYQVSMNQLKTKNNLSTANLKIGDILLIP
ncbi:MAG: N-acetylmuramoyl-L-alanine amidase [Methylophaga sp.]|nr:MAG: N-acetylmuramoyl-L-alanine amidase [Methylophaga sp.]